MKQFYVYSILFDIKLVFPLKNKFLHKNSRSNYDLAKFKFFSYLISKANYIILISIRPFTPRKTYIFGFKSRASSSSSYRHSYLSIALEASKVAHVPRSALRLGALVGEDDLVAGAASRLEGLGVVAAAVKPAVPPEVDKIDQQLSAHAADEAGGMPERGRSGPTGRHGHLAGRDRAPALAASGPVRTLQLARVSAS